jgi:hypothetical protein
MSCELDRSTTSRRVRALAWCAIALGACQLDTSVPEPDTDALAPLDASLPPLRDASTPVLRPRDAGTGRGGGAPLDAGKDSGAARDAGDMREDARVPSDAATDARTPTPPPPVDAGRCGGPCPSDKPVCLEDGTCAECAERSDCTRPGAPRCEQATHTCVACLEDADCDGGTPACDITTHTCVGCVNAGDCHGDTPACDITKHACVGCLQSSDCSRDRHCQADTQSCVECLTDGDCHDARRAHCAAGACTACTDSAQCAHVTENRHVCATAADDDDDDDVAGTCVECATHADCTDLARPECDDFECGRCTDDDACEGRPNATVCDERRGRRGSGACVECTARDDDACGDGRSCDEERLVCVEAGDGDGEMCASCDADGDCIDGFACGSNGGASYCVPATNVELCVATCENGSPLSCLFSF